LRAWRVRPKARVFVICELGLFGEALEGLLGGEPGLEIVGREADPREAVRRVKEAHPDVIVVTDGEAATGLDAELLDLVREGLHVRIVEVHLGANTVCVYCGEQQHIREFQDLVDALGRCAGLSRDPQAPLSPVMEQPIE
jgi:hypothetical protein